MRSFISQRLFAAAAASAILATLAAVPATAAPLAPEAKAAIEAARAEVRASREALLAANLQLSTEQADKFWPLYREYSNKRISLGDDRLGIILDYASAYPDVSDAIAADLVSRSLKNNRQLTDLTHSYAKKFGKILPAATLMQFLQLEKRLDLLAELELQRAIPVVEVPKQ